CYFLEEIWNMYDNFVKNVNGSKYGQLLDFCYKGTIFQKPNMEEYKNMCKKLLRNLLLLADGNYGYENFFKYCDMLYIWIYFETKKKKLTNSIIEEIFDDLVKFLTEEYRKACPYFSYSENLHEPHKLMKLRIFEHNIYTFQNILDNISDPHNCSCLKYAYECINIYNDMNKRFCATDEHKNTINKGTCDILEIFNTLYSNYIRNVNRGIYELPLLSDTTNATYTPTDTYVTRCLLNKQKSKLDSSTVDQSSNPKQISISTAFGSMAGIPPFLVLIYKVNIIYT
ncbi:hypothetical protein PCYB_006150, partial [Plasmodium cynomolgi strain B]